jgi:thiol-disulfide isomerase/thioredoxin
LRHGVHPFNSRPATVPIVLASGLVTENPQIWPCARGESNRGIWSGTPLTGVFGGLALRRTSPAIMRVRALRWTDYRASMGFVARSTRLRIAAMLVVIVVPALALFGWLQSAANVAPSVPPSGSPAPPVSLTRLYGGAASLTQERGNVVVLNFWATWCDSCPGEMSALQRVADDLRAEHFSVFEVDYEEDAATIDPARQQFGLRMPILLDARGDVTQRYGASMLPSTFLIDQQGILRYGHLGPLGDGDAQTQWSTAWLEQQARSLLESG